MNMYLTVTGVVILSVLFIVLYVFSVMFNKAMMNEIFLLEGNIYLVFCLVPVLNFVVSLLIMITMVSIFSYGVVAEEREKLVELRKQRKKDSKGIAKSHLTRYLIEK
jgi:hypothetical protein